MTNVLHTVHGVHPGPNLFHKYLHIQRLLGVVKQVAGPILVVLLIVLTGLFIALVVVQHQVWMPQLSRVGRRHV